MLPQGSFDAFLKGDSKERRELLFSLYGLEGLTRIRERAVSRLGELREKLAAAEAKARQLEGVSEEALENTREELRQAAAILDKAVSQSRLAMVDVGNDRQVSDVRHGDV